MFKTLEDQITQREAVALLDLSYQSLSCKNEEKFKKLVLGLEDVFPFENATCAHGNVADLIEKEKSELSIDYCDVSYPRGYLDFYFQQGFVQTDAVLQEFMTNLTPVNWNDVGKKCGFSYPESVRAIDFKMVDGWSHATLDMKTMNITVFYFGSPIPENGHNRSRAILEYATPFLSCAYNQVLSNENKSNQQLTKREIEVLNWIKEGKSSWEISQILKCSERTVNFHVTNIKATLGVVNRTQAVAVGLQCGIIQF